CTLLFFFFQAEDGIRDFHVTGVQTCALPIFIIAEMKRGNGIMTHADLANYHAVWREPIVGTYKDYKIISMPPPSSGGIALVALLQSVEQYPLRAWGFQSDSTVRAMVEAERRIY